MAVLFFAVTVTADNDQILLKRKWSYDGRKEKAANAAAG